MSLTESMKELLNRVSTTVGSLNMLSAHNGYLAHSNCAYVTHMAAARHRVTTEIIARFILKAVWLLADDRPILSIWLWAMTVKNKRHYGRNVNLPCQGVVHVCFTHVLNKYSQGRKYRQLSVLSFHLFSWNRCYDDGEGDGVRGKWSKSLPDAVLPGLCGYLDWCNIARNCVDHWSGNWFVLETIVHSAVLLLKDWCCLHQDRSFCSSCPRVGCLSPCRYRGRSNGCNWNMKGSIILEICSLKLGCFNNILALDWLRILVLEWLGILML